MQTDERREPLFERRARRRAPLRWAVRLYRKAAPLAAEPLLNHSTNHTANHVTSHSIETVTRNISSSGFYCVVPESFPTEHPLECQITIVPSGSYAQEDEILLQGTARIVRLENLNPEGVGLACQLEDYAIVKVPLHTEKREFVLSSKNIA